ncbi:O-methylsterigmatocystin oxidoreductase [Daldinia vernicosa]|uniref:O-methylsterigmatocystin oxidoreductase n=1 Tax=Daldinia vernicosa TaxID=114800 RepID=UPI002007EC2F|nr:O-methylsterigmatocystin oxidoreductase [Daldinia vernicosa]KAI0849538.1 O-methylsterigmatocystin oxidoreductase [Daldinia vernicosa]
MAQFLALHGFIIAILCVVACCRLCSRKRTGSSLPPGPKPLPIVGNLMDLPPKGVPEFQHWLKHRETYGPISSITIMGQTLVICHDKQAAHDLMEKRSKLCSGRPKTEFANNLCGYGDWLVMQQDNDKLRRCRKLVHQQLGTKALVAEFYNVQEAEVCRFLFRVLNQPENLIKHLKTKTSAMISKIVYGYTIEPNKADPLVDLVDLNMANAQRATIPMAWLVDAIPALNYLPTGFPGTGFKKTARLFNKINQMATEVPFAFVQRQIAIGSHRPSFVANLVQQAKDGDVGGANLDRDKDDIKWTAAMLYNGGLDTTVALLSGFFLALVMFPQVQCKAQEEIDRVVGIERLPGFQDRDKLPYIEAVVKEAFRWWPSAPLGFPHVVSEDTTYKGHFIPKGATLFPGIWWFCHDPEVYEEPTVFNPDRYLEPRNEPSPYNEIFGYGRRVCPGRHLSDSSVFLTIAQTLAVFTIRKVLDKEGRQTEVKLEATPGLINLPVEFPYEILPRSMNHEDLIRSLEVQQPWEESDAGLLEDVNQ